MVLRSLSLNLDDALYQAALGRAQREGKTLEQVLAEFITSYTIHIEGVCPEPSLLALYERLNAAGRG